MRHRPAALHDGAQALEQFEKSTDNALGIVALATIDAMLARPEDACHLFDHFHVSAPKRRLKRASSRTKRSKRRFAATTSRSAKTRSADEPLAQRNKARCARSPRSMMEAVTSFTPVFPMSPAMHRHSCRAAARR